MADLAIDIGNTNAKFGIFEGTQLEETAVIPRRDIDRMQHFMRRVRYEYIVVSNVSGMLSDQVELLVRQNSSSGRLLFVSHQMKLPIVLDFHTPQTLGIDRIAAAAGAAELFPQKTSLIIDAGSCITCDLLVGGRIFSGGSISPGVNMRLRAMNEFTGKLPQVETDGEVELPGKSTIHSMRAGAVYGVVMELEGYIHHYKNSFDKLNIVLTGGEADFFVNKLKTEIFASPHLVLYGLNSILKYHVE